MKRAGSLLILPCHTQWFVYPSLQHSVSSLLGEIRNLHKDTAEQDITSCWTPLCFLRLKKTD